MTAESLAWAITGALAGHLLWHTTSNYITYWKAGRR